jgi:hypothetical protein
MRNALHAPASNSTARDRCRPLRCTALAAAAAALVLVTAAVPPKALAAGAQGDAAAAPPTSASAAQKQAFAVTVAYVSQFYPLWFTYNQSRFASHNRMVGPSRVSPLYQIVVAINVDTLYASTFLEVAAQPLILTVPATDATYSVLLLDPYGDIFSTNISTTGAGVYALTGPGFSGTLPSSVTQVKVPYNYMELIFRADKFSASGEDQTAEASAFRAALETQELCDYTGTACPGGSSTGGTTLVLPETAFAQPYKTIADTEIATEPLMFLKQLQTAVHGTPTPPMSADVKALSSLFDRLFGDGGKGMPWDFATGAQAAHQLILDRYLTHTGTTNWINFTNIGNWGDQVVERSSITEFIQYGNGHDTAAYYQAFQDGTGAPLNGKGGQGYVLHFAAGQLPDAQRFWSLTAYTPNAIELVANSAAKYDVASYQPGLVTNSDGSLDIYMAPEQPAGVPAANWLPVPTRAFNVMLRVYGPEGSVASATYVPPAIVKSP